jgi:hypothetical protein
MASLGYLQVPGEQGFLPPLNARRTHECAHGAASVLDAQNFSDIYGIETSLASFRFPVRSPVPRSRALVRPLGMPRLGGELPGSPSL